MACQHLVATVALVRAAEIISATRCPKRLRVGYIGDPRGLSYYGGIFRGLQAHAEVKWCPVKGRCSLEALDAVIIGFLEDSAFHAVNWTRSDLEPYRRSGRLGCFINKEYHALQGKLDKIRDARCSVGFSAHSNASLFSTSRQPFYYVPFGVDLTVFGGVDAGCVVALGGPYDPRETDPTSNVSWRSGDWAMENSSCHKATPIGAYTYDFGFTGVLHTPFQSTSWRHVVISMSDQLRSLGLRIYIPPAHRKGVYSFTGGQMPMADYVQLLHSSRMWLSTLSPAKLVGTRYFEVLASGTTLLVTPPSPLLEALFGPPGINYVVFETTSQLTKVLLHFAAHENERLAIVRRAQQHVLVAHSWQIRAKTVLQKLIGHSYCHEDLRRVQAWSNFSGEVK